MTDTIFEPGRKRFFRVIRLLLPAAVPVLLCVVFLAAVSAASGSTLAQEQKNLENALKNGAVQTYALTGSYPESLSVLLESYHITYDAEKFVVEYIPNGPNLFPMISVLPMTGQKGDSI